MSEGILMAGRTVKLAGGMIPAVIGPPDRSWIIGLAQRQCGEHDHPAVP